MLNIIESINLANKIITRGIEAGNRHEYLHMMRLSAVMLKEVETEIVDRGYERAADRLILDAAWDRLAIEENDHGRCFFQK